EVEARGPEWQAFLTEVRAENQKTKDELNGKIDRLNLKVKDLEDGLKRISSKYQVSLSYILQWRRKYPRDSRSEEHTSELQSRFDLVCRLLLDKNKQERNAKHTQQE